MFVFKRFFGRDQAGDWTPYLTRFGVGRLVVHVFHRGDAEDAPHDHPWDFWTFPLVGYTELVLKEDGVVEANYVAPFKIHHRPAEYRHRVVGPVSGDGNLITLVWKSKERRVWGFWPLKPGRLRFRMSSLRVPVFDRHFVPWKEHLGIKE